MAAAVSKALFLRKLYAEFSLFTRVSFDDNFKLPGMTIRVDNVAAKMLADDQSRVKHSGLKGSLNG
eukprot:330239-Chlamydomonas_euryale.AAC.1